jgi:hypothetical protein
MLSKNFLRFSAEMVVLCEKKVGTGFREIRLHFQSAPESLQGLIQLGLILEHIPQIVEGLRKGGPQTKGLSVASNRRLKIALSSEYDAQIVVKIRITGIVGYGFPNEPGCQLQFTAIICNQS